MCTSKPSSSFYFLSLGILTLETQPPCHKGAQAIQSGAQRRRNQWEQLTAFVTRCCSHPKDTVWSNTRMNLYKRQICGSRLITLNQHPSPWHLRTQNNVQALISQYSYLQKYTDVKKWALFQKKQRKWPISRPEVETLGFLGESVVLNGVWLGQTREGVRD